MLRPAKHRVSSRPIARTSSAESGGSSVTARAVTHPVSVTMTASARSSSSGIRSTRASVVCWSGGASSRPVSFVTVERCDDVRSMKPSRPERRVGSVSRATAVFDGRAGGNELT